ncbi:hypothetical protein ACFOSC_07960 [Streptantibioticus rubrisoli]|uniref:DUF916 domain-containing protein n=1 Tax=Streptantibioticus rubrisoli TaxID=1387313 RepID=A0ABT1P7D8_9ACTN|nr:hypothetical protein [Streptantibioticus rubrisoli]MCQ4041294.1 hypothetical protein [Streptantibioticus rubrisoli]
MTRRVVQQRTARKAHKAAAGSAVALTAGLALVVGTAGTGQAATAASGAQAAPSCGAEQGSAAAAADSAVPSLAAVGTAGQKISYGLATQAPIGLWSSSSVTLRTPVSKGTVRLDVSSRGFSTDSLEVQRYVPRSHRWVDLDSTPGTGSWPRHGVFTFPVSAAASAGHPYTVALRVQDLDRPGSFTVAASVNDGHGHTYRAAARTAAATRPTVTVSGWQSGTTLVRGGAARDLKVTVKNTTDRAYPALNASYYAYGQGSRHALVPKDLVLKEYQPGRGWIRVPLVPNGCDPGMAVTLRPTAKGPLAPGATAVYRLRVAVAKSAPSDVAHADAGLSVGNGELPFASQELPFTIHG